MSQQDVLLTKIQEAFKTTFDVDSQSISIETTANNIAGWDSVGHLSLANNLEQALGITFDVDELMEMENVREIVRVIEAKLSKKA